LRRARSRNGSKCFAVRGRCGPRTAGGSNSANRITIDPEPCGGRPCIRGLRIRVIDVLDLLGNGLTPQQVIEELPDLNPEDIQACLK